MCSVHFRYARSLNRTHFRCGVHTTLIFSRSSEARTDSCRATTPSLQKCGIPHQNYKPRVARRERDIYLWTVGGGGGGLEEGSAGGDCAQVFEIFALQNSYIKMIIAPDHFFVCMLGFLPSSQNGFRWGEGGVQLFFMHICILHKILCIISSTHTQGGVGWGVVCGF